MADAGHEQFQEGGRGKEGGFVVAAADQMAEGQDRFAGSLAEEFDAGFAERSRPGVLGGDAADIVDVAVEFVGDLFPRLAGGAEFGDAGDLVGREFGNHGMCSIDVHAYSNGFGPERKAGRKLECGMGNSECGMKSGDRVCWLGW